jgi:hypothetical protein
MVVHILPIRRLRQRVVSATVDAIRAPVSHYNHPMVELRIVDSITELGISDEGCIAVSGSHGGMSSARYALAARPWLSVFNDAGVGKDAAGLAALAFLQSHGLAACTVTNESARIGEAQSTYEDGVVSHANALATALGVEPGQACRTMVGRLRSGH